MSPKAPTAPLRVTLDKIASAAMLADIKPRVDLSLEIPARGGAVVAGRILNAKSTYNMLEDAGGRMRRLMPGDVVAGVLGHRNALHGYAGKVPTSVQRGDVLNILNLGGVMGQCTSYNPDVGSPFEVEVLGGVLHYPTFGERKPQPAVIERSQDIEVRGLPENLPPVVIICGTSMNAGKTTAICEIIRQVKGRGLKIAAAKCTGVSLLQDTLEMRDFGASRAISFMDFGVVTTTEDDAVPVTQAIIRELASDGPDLVLLELGDGLLGTYGVSQILHDEVIKRALKATLLCGSDPVGAWGGAHLLQERFGIRPSAVTGPVTDNRGGAASVEKEFGIPAFNARTQSEDLAKVVLACIKTPTGADRK